MKRNKYILIILLIFNLTFSQESKHETSEIHKRTEKGWDIVKSNIEVIIYESNNFNSINIISNNVNRIFYIKSKLTFIEESQVYIIVDDNWIESRVRIDRIDKNNIILYFYSNRLEEKYFRLMLNRCL